MKTEQDWNEAILKITLEIQEQYPELTKYISEMPVTIPNEEDPHITNKNLAEYYNSLQNMVLKYNENQHSKII